MSDHITSITDATFEEEVLKSDTPVLVDYWAEWCGPCKAITPVLEDVAPEYLGKVKIVKMNIDENPNIFLVFLKEVVVFVGYTYSIHLFLLHLLVYLIVLLC